MKFVYLPAALAALLPVAALACDVMNVEDGYIRSSNPKTAAAFMVLDNRRDSACTLTAIRSDAAEKVELHTHKEVDGVMQMGQIEGGIEVAAGTQHALQRGGDHVMMMGLKRPLLEGETVALALDFGGCGVVDVTLPVDNARAPQAAGAMSHGKMDHGKMDHSKMGHGN